MDYRNKKYFLSKTASFRNMGEEGIILMADSGQLYSTNTSGSAFIEQLQGSNQFIDIVNAVSEQFDVEISVLESDLSELAEYLYKEGVLKMESDE